MSTALARREQGTGRQPPSGHRRSLGRSHGATDHRRRGTGTVGRPLWLLIPGGLLLLVVVVVPLCLAIWISLTDLDQYTLRSWLSAPFLGLGNFTEALTSGPLLHSVWVSVAFSVLTTLFTLPLGLAAAFAASDRFRGRALVRSLFLIPYVLPTFVVGTVWRIALGPNGAVNSLLGHLGVDGGNWLIGDRTFWTLVLVDTWAAWPFVYLLCLAGLLAVQRETHEAAAVDGASWSQKVRHIVLPALRGPISLAIVIATLSHLNNFTLPFLLFGSPAPRPVDVLPIQVYATSFQTFRFGYASAISVASLVIVLVPLLVYLRAVRLDTGAERGGVA